LPYERSEVGFERAGAAAKAARAFFVLLITALGPAPYNGRRSKGMDTMSRSTTEAINSYLTDMLALEEHILVVIEAQVKVLTDAPQLLVLTLDAIQVTVEHVESLKNIIQERDAGAGNALAEAVKRATSVVAGAGAAAADLVRNEKVPKDLRDDYTAFSLATVSYVMLLTTAMSLNDQPVAELAERHLGQYTKVVMTLNNIIPSAVIAELREEGLPAQEQQLPAIARRLKGVWSDPYNEVPEVDEVSVA
jgi:ferritin-like metal-binding protein YciE